MASFYFNSRDFFSAIGLLLFVQLTDGLDVIREVILEAIWRNTRGKFNDFSVLNRCLKTWFIILTIKF